MKTLSFLIPVLLLAGLSPAHAKGCRCSIGHFDDKNETFTAELVAIDPRGDGMDIVIEHFNDDVYATESEALSACEKAKANHSKYCK